MGLKLAEGDFGRVACLLRVLGNTSSLKVLHEAGSGFKSGLEFAKKLRLTPRKYYRCLRRLHELGVLECRVSSNAGGREHVYTLTPFGRRLREVVFNDIQSLLDGESLEFEGAAVHSRVGVITRYEDLVKVVVRLVEEAKSRIFLATRYLDLSVSQSLMQAILRGVELKSVTSEALNLPEFMKLMGNFMRNMRPSLFKIPGLAAKMDNYRVGNVPTSFIMVDGKNLVWELPTEDFEMAFISKDGKLLEAFEDHFWKLWKAASKLPTSFRLGGL